MSELKHRQLEWLRGNKDAFDLVTALCDVAHLWDDLIDGDRPVSPADVHNALSAALVDIPSNAFYRQHFYALMPVIKVAIANWHAANVMELTDSEQDKRIAFVLRSSYADLVTACADILGGPAWASHVALEARRSVSAEGWEAYLAALGQEKRKD